MTLASVICVGIALLTTGEGIFEAIGYILTAIAVAVAVIRFAFTKDNIPSENDEKHNDTVNHGEK